MKHLILAFATVITILSFCHTANAFWGSDSRDKESGLDLSKGYDTNTVTTIRGTITTLPARHKGSEHTDITVTSQLGVVTVLLGPWTYWERQNFPVAKDQEISITGSSALGKDGAHYLFAQKLENKTSGCTLVLRSDSGAPNWSRGGSGMGNGAGRGTNGSGYRGSGMRGNTMRGGGMR